MNAKSISLIYFYLVSAGSLILIVVGLFYLFNFTFNSIYFEKYPLQTWEDNCDEQIRYSAVPVTVDNKPASPSAQELEQLKKECNERVERQRIIKKVDDIKNGIMFTTVGLIIFGLHFWNARRISK